MIEINFIITVFYCKNILVLWIFITGKECICGAWTTIH